MKTVPLVGNLPIEKPPYTIDLNSWSIEGDNISLTERKLADLAGVFADERAYSLMDPDVVVYRVQTHNPVDEGIPGGLFFGSTTLYPGKVGDEYFMTRGHYHSIPDRGEYYWGVEGEGVLLLMDWKRNVRAERIYRGSLHYIDGNLAHRLANTGSTSLVVGACWHSDAGHDYTSIDKAGFAARLLEVDGAPTLVGSSR